MGCGKIARPTAALLRSLQWVSDSRSRVAEPRGEMGGLLCPTAALLRSLQWVSDGRSRVAEPKGCGGIARPTAALLRSLQWVSYRRVPPGHCVSHACHSASTHDTAISHRTPQVPHSGTDYPKPTASCEAAPLWVEQSPHTP